MNDLDEQLVCRTMGSDLHVDRGEALALLQHLQEDPTMMRRRLEVLVGEKTLAQVDDEEEAERRAEFEPPSAAASIKELRAGYEAARKIGRFLAEPGDWNGGDVCDFAATELIAAGLLTDAECNE